MAQRSLENDLKHYFKEIKSLFPVYGVKEKQFLTSFMSDVYEYIALNPESDYTQLISVFNAPNAIVAQYIADADSAYLSKRIKTAKLARRCILIVILLALVSAVASGIRNYMLYIEGQGHYIEREIVEIERD
jgi:hypothetical protein